MILRDPRCGSNDCDYNENGMWVHVGGCGALVEPVRIPVTGKPPAGSFLEYLVRGEVDVTVDEDQPVSRTTAE